MKSLPELSQLDMEILAAMRREVQQEALNDLRVRGLDPALGGSVAPALFLALACAVPIIVLIIRAFPG